MKISRYIKFPLIFGILVMLNSLFFSFEPSLYKLLSAFSGGAFIGIILQIISNYKTRQTESEAAEDDFSTYQNRTVSLLCEFDKAFDLCLESIEFLKKGKIELADKEQSIIKAKTGINLKSFGNLVEFKLKEITENLTEVEISTKPSVPTTLIDYGESLETVKKLVDFFDAKNVELNYKQIEGKSAIPIEFAEQNSQSNIPINK